jgi:hypothetical protein
MYTLILDGVLQSPASAAASVIPRVLEYCWGVCSTIQEISANVDASLLTLQLNASLFIAKASRVAPEMIPENMLAFVFQHMLVAHSLDSQTLVDSILDSLLSSPRDFYVHGLLQALFEHEHSVVVLSHIYSAVVRNESTTFFYRQVLVPRILVAISRLGVSDRLVHRKIALNLILMGINWEKRRLAEGIPDGELTDEVKSIFLTFLVRLCLLTCENAESIPLSRRCLVLIKSLFEIWEFIQVDTSFIVRAIHKSDNSAGRFNAPHQFVFHFAANYGLIALKAQFDVL